MRRKRVVVLACASVLFLACSGDEPSEPEPSEDVADDEASTDDDLPEPEEPEEDRAGELEALAATVRTQVGFLEMAATLGAEECDTADLVGALHEFTDAAGTDAEIVGSQQVALLEERADLIGAACEDGHEEQTEEFAEELRDEIDSIVAEAS